LLIVNDAECFENQRQYSIFDGKQSVFASLLLLLLYIFSLVQSCLSQYQKNQKQKIPETLSVDGTVAMEQLLANSAPLTEHFNNLALRNALYLEFQMLMKMGRHNEANGIYKSMRQLSKPQHMLNGEPQRDSVPQRVAARVEMNTSSEDESSLEPHPARS
jgi:hypothetical protein